MPVSSSGPLFIADFCGGVICALVEHLESLYGAAQSQEFVYMNLLSGSEYKSVLQ